MLSISVSIAVDSVRPTLDDLKFNQIRRAHYRAMNRALTSGRLMASQTFRDVYSLPAGEVKERISIDVTGSSSDPLDEQGGELRVLEKPPVPLFLYSNRQTKEGVSVKMGADRKLIQGAFVATMPSGHMGIFQRDPRKAQRRIMVKDPLNPRGYHSSSLPIRELWGISPYQYFKAAGATHFKEIAGATEEIYRDNLEHELQYAADQAKQQNQK